MSASFEIYIVPLPMIELPNFCAFSGSSRSAPSRPSRLSLLVHAADLLSFAATFLWLPHTTNPLHRGVGGPFQFLTVLALSLSTIVFGLGLLADVAPQSPALYALKVRLSALCATPLALLVGLLYWSNRAAVAGLLIPRGHEVPFVPDLGLHVVPVVALTLDLVLLPRVLFLVPHGPAPSRLAMLWQLARA
ncbi:hypothetical protein PG994_005224 [Apiospora phragmitis]|uniref:Uncharacterized protein n=1 Tax=Apiospora phragmitis TaxID=2905665 RepID=A0ABR1VST5_9PEZI